MKNRCILSSVRLGVVALAMLFAEGCATSIVQGDGVNQSSAATTVVSLPGRLLVLSPKVVFEDVRSEALLPPEMHHGPEICEALAAAALEALRACGAASVTLAKDGKLSPDQLVLAEKSSASANRLFLSSPDASVLANLKALATSGEPTSVLVQFTRVKVGPDGYWNPNAGRTALSSASTSHFQAAILDCQSGRIVWQSSVYLRDVPRPGSSDLTNALRLLYASLKIQR